MINRCLTAEENALVEKVRCVLQEWGFAADDLPIEEPISGGLWFEKQFGNICLFVGNYYISFWVLPGNHLIADWRYKTGTPMVHRADRLQHQ